jgi:mono/diheme cytochrome c family protein
VVISGDSRFAYVANTFDDTISIVDLKQREAVGTISLGPLRELTEVERGEQLFYNARLSHDSWMSCNSCHTDGHTNGQTNDNLSDGSFGAPKRVLSLLGVAETGPWAWNGTIESLETQVRNSVTKTMRGTAPSDQQVADLVAYMKTLKAPPPPMGFDERSNAAAIDAGRLVFARSNCKSCHAPPTYTSKIAYDVGLTDDAGNTRFNPPSLRGVGWRTSLFHDGRAGSLDEVFVKYKHRLAEPLSRQEVDELVAFLRSL